MTLWYYTVPVPTDALRSQTPTDRQSVSTLTGLAGATPAVDATGREPGDLRLDGQFRDEFAAIQAAELRGLASSDAFGAMPLFIDDATLPQAGYYTAERVGGRQAVPQTQALADIDVALTQAGTRGQHRRRITTAPTQVATSFGTTVSALVGIPAAAQGVSWLSADTSSRQAATPTTTVTAEGGDVDLFDVDDAPFATVDGRGPALIYDLSLAREGDIDVAVYDTLNNPEMDSEGRFAWQRVFQPQHQFAGEAIISTGRIRLRIDTTVSPPTLAAEEYTGGSWSTLSLGESSWELFDYNVGGGKTGRLGPERTTARLTFRNPADDTLFALDATAHRGRDRIQFAEPTSATTPAGLTDMLAPLADGTVLDPTETRGLVARDTLPTIA